MLFLFLPISASILLLETKAISMPEKKALKIKVTSIPMIIDGEICSTMTGF